MPGLRVLRRLDAVFFLVVLVFLLGIMMVASRIPGVTRYGWRVLAASAALFVVLSIGEALLRASLTFVAAHAVFVAVAAVAVLLAAGLLLARRAGHDIGAWLRFVASPQRPRGERAGRAAGGATARTTSFRPDRRPFVGRTRRGALRLVDAEDTIGTVGPPRCGKTAGILVPQALMWDGPLISASVRDDVLRATAHQRARQAAPRGGGVLVFDPTDAVPAAELTRLGARKVTWNPVDGCEDPRVATSRAAAMVWAAGRAVGATPGKNEKHFEDLARSLLRAYFHAAALRAPGGHGSLDDVLSWVHDRNLERAASVLDSSSSPDGPGWAGWLRGQQATGRDERGSMFTTADNALAAFSLSTIRANCRTTTVDARSLTATGSSLFLVSGVLDQNIVAPVFSGLLEGMLFELVDTLAREQGGVLGDPVLVQLDEVANIAPLPSLTTLLTLAGGSGVCLSWAAQNWQQIAARYGQDGMKAIWQATKAKLVFGDVADSEMLDGLSTMMGRRIVHRTSRSREVMRPLRPGSRSVAETDDARLPVGDIFSGRDGAHLFYRGDYEIVRPAPYFDPVAGAPFASVATSVRGGVPA